MTYRTSSKLHISKLPDQPNPEIGEIIEVAYDGILDQPTGFSRNYTETGSYKYTKQGWKRIESPSSKILTSDFVARDGDRYYVEHAEKIGDGQGAMINQLHDYGVTTQDTSGPHNGSGANYGQSAAAQVFSNNPNGSNTGGYGFATGWQSHDENSAVPGRLIIDLGRQVRISAIEWQGEGDTGYGPISGPRQTTLRFGDSPFNTTVSNTSGQHTAIAKEWQNLNWNANQSSLNGLAEYFDLKSANAGNAIICRYIAIDLETSWDTRNMSLRHVLFHEEVSAGDASINIDINETVNSIYVIDGNGNFDVTSCTNVNLGSDVIKLQEPEKYRFERDGTEFRVYVDRTLVARGNV